MEAPTDLDRLCTDLGISQKRRARLAHEKGDELLSWLQKQWRWSKEQDADNFLHVNPGFGKDDYTDNPGKAARSPDGTPEWAPPSDEIGRYRASRDARDAYQAARMEEVGSLLSACRELRAAIDAMPKDRKQRMSRTLWKLKGRLDETEREIRRRVAA